MNVASALEHAGISSTSAITAVQQVRNIIEDGGDGKRVSLCSKLLLDLFSVQEDFRGHTSEKVGQQHVWALKITQAMVEFAIKSNCEIDNVDFMLAQARMRASNFILNPNNGWMFAVDEPPATAKTVETAAVTDKVDVQVEVKADGTMKKGGKGILAEALYKKFVAEATTPITNMEFVKMLQDDLGMSLAGARTYAANCKKKFTK